MTSQEIVGAVRAPRPAFVLLDRGRSVDQGPQDSPRLFDYILSCEERLVTNDRVVKEAFVRARWSAQLIDEGEIHGDVP